MVARHHDDAVARPQKAREGVFGGGVLVEHGVQALDRSGLGVELAAGDLDVPKVDEVPVDHELPAPLGALGHVVLQKARKVLVHLGRQVHELPAAAPLEMRPEVKVGDEQQILHRRTTP